MAGPKHSAHKPEDDPSGWALAEAVLLDYLEAPRKAEDLFGAQPAADPLTFRRAERLVDGVCRSLGFFQNIFSRLWMRQPHRRIEVILYLAACELMRAEAQTRPKIIHFAVERARAASGKPGAGFANALLRKVLPALEAEPLAIARASHPDWLVRRWEERFGTDQAGALLLWNQAEPPPVYLLIPPHKEGEAAGTPGLEATRWERFWRWQGGGISEAELPEVLDALEAYVQDPFTRHVVDLLEPLGQGPWLDLCAAPGGKTWSLVQRCVERHGKAPEMLVAVDQPGPRLRRLKDNLQRLGQPGVHTVGADALGDLAAALAARELPERYAGVILDAPCSNTGVLRRRPEVKARLQPEDIQTLAAEQQALLSAAAQRVAAPGGRLVYSTCSLEREENEAIVEAFLAAHPGWELLESRLSLPGRDGHDGGGAFLLRPQ